MPKRLKRAFFSRMAVEVAEDLLGKILVFGKYRGIITETEAYRGQDDPASHSHRGPTPRSAIMFGKPGMSYVYFIYGMYYCLNIVTEPMGSPSAVLIRGIKLLEPTTLLLDGPGKLCRHLGITKEQNGLDMTTHKTFYIEDAPKVSQFEKTTRIGLKVGKDKHWRFLTTDLPKGKSK